MGGRALLPDVAVPALHTVLVGRQEVHLFRFDGVVPPEAPEGWLSGHEHQRWQRLRFERDRRAYLQSHWALRQVLAWHLQSAPALLQFSEDAHGKPSLADPRLPGFSWAHCDGRAAVVIGPRTLGWGVDIERQRALPDMPALVQHQFTAAEQAGWAALPPDQQETAFFRVWTRKEAALKALGSGLLLPAHEAEVGLGPAPATVDLTWVDQPFRIELWSGSPWGDLQLALAQSTPLTRACATHAP